MVDRTGETCERCGKGEYAESHLDDMGKTLHCHVCGDGIRRWEDEGGALVEGGKGGEGGDSPDSDDAGFPDDSPPYHFH